MLVPSSSALPLSLTIVVRQLGLWKGSSTYSRDKSYGHTHIRGLTDARYYGGHDHCTTTANCTTIVIVFKFPIQRRTMALFLRNSRYRKDRTRPFVCSNLGSSKVTKLECAHMVLATNYRIMRCRWQKVKWCI